MAIEKIDIEKYLQLSNQHPVIDVRSPSEFNHAQIPNAYSLPLFTDEERKIVGTTYKQQTRKAAIKIGLDFFGVRMKGIVEEVEGIGQLTTDNTILVHCWRGGMRSAAVSWLLDMYGFKVYTLTGGYKAFRNWVLKQFVAAYNLKILGGYTGAGKTMILQELNRKGYLVIDLENLANHKGSAFGGIGEKAQPTQEMFENLLACKLNEVPPTSEVWLEDESQRIGKLIIPNSFWEKMRASPVYFLDIPFEERLKYLMDTYGNFDKEELSVSILRIQKRLGGLETKNAMCFLAENNIRECFKILLTYYDKLYTKGLHNRENLSSLLNKIDCENVNVKQNIQKILYPKVIV
ncbi:MAG: tRNA 2-selenouridine(34) synthase MnmH [Chitinophagaceae bacterium]|nr:tRNA 2-selenouridine(34) synthase MnmH [Chitinophagaceae bacterium]